MSQKSQIELEEHYVGLLGKDAENSITRFFFVNFGLPHLLMSFSQIIDPEGVSTDFVFAAPVDKFILDSFRADKAKICFMPYSQSHTLHCPDFNSYPAITSSKKAVVAYSGGKDSLWNMAWAQQKYGPENVLAVHIEGLNRAQGRREKEMVLRQARDLGFRNLRIIKIEQNTDQIYGDGMHTGYFYYMFIVSLITPAAMEFGADKIITEGYQHPSVMHRFNSVLQKLGVRVKTYWRDTGEMDVVKELAAHNPRWLKYICTCNVETKEQKRFRAALVNLIPTFPFGETECGFCEKCRIASVSRILHDPDMNDAEPLDILSYLLDCIRWINSLQSPPSEDFCDSLVEACEKYGGESVWQIAMKHVAMLNQREKYGIKDYLQQSNLWRIGKQMGLSQKVIIDAAIGKNHR